MASDAAGAIRTRGAIMRLSPQRMKAGRPASIRPCLFDNVRAGAAGQVDIGCRAVRAALADIGTVAAPAERRVNGGFVGM